MVSEEENAVRFLSVNKVDKISDLSMLEQHKVLGLLCMHRCAGVAYYNLIQNQMLSQINREMRTTLQSIYESNIRKTKSLRACLDYMSEIFKKVIFPYAFLKGACLIDIYPEGTRTSNDIDILVSKKNVPEITNLLLENGFQQGYIRNDQFIKATRKDLVNALMNRGETTPFVKQVDLEELKYLEIDINI